MYITDLNGNQLEIENLQLAVMQADDYRHYRHSDPQYNEADNKRQVYWEDIYQKLLVLQQE